MQKLSLILVCFFLIFQNSFANTYSTDPQNFVKELVGDVIQKLSDKNLSKEDKANYVKEVAINNVDINALGLYTLGELRKSTDKGKISEYQKVFEKYFLKSLTSRLSDYASNKFEVFFF